MKNETEEMLKARHALQELSASDPAVSSNMLRYVAAYRIMLTGRRRGEQRQHDPRISGGFVLTHGEEALCAAADRLNGTDSIYIAFDVDDGAAPPVAAGIFRREGEQMMVYGDCRLWSPADDGRSLLVPVGGKYVGYFAHRPGKPLKFVDAALPGDFSAGCRRANARMQRLLASDELRERNGGGYLNIVRNDGPGISVKVTRVAA
ncbi:hypothetical protein EJC47_11110 [Sphingomonas sp. TF3]|uniref:hypothetical protein n=1 Tax=Sphingomonas sp. TF3 TaxID=2495580 RepID=UPI000F8998F3|nr:hypothetical protein [Sphingomonas sp. TF3]RUN76512.1 hypothetical protein EJC47_11110 [Sphingomonas sp. TF3]